MPSDAGTRDPAFQPPNPEDEVPLTSRVAMLFIPGSVERRLAILDRLPDESFILDLEDSVPEEEKETARRLVARAIAGRGEQCDLHARVNPATSLHFASDVDAVVRPGLRGIVLPKVESPDDVRRADAVITLHERRAGLPAQSIALMATIETVAGLDSVRAIASMQGRLDRLCFGAGDFALDAGLLWPEPGEPNPTVTHAQVTIVLASRAFNLVAPHDGAFIRHRDHDGLRHDAAHARRIGFGGKHAIHPEQLQVIREAFLPTSDERDRARRMVAAFDRAVAAGRAAIDVDGEMVDYAVANRARELTERIDGGAIE